MSATKRKASDAELDEEANHAEPPQKRVCTLIPKIVSDPSGHYCASCSEMIHTSHYVCMFMGCGHMIHRSCCEDDQFKCPVCHLVVGDDNPAHHVMFSVARYMSGMNFPERQSFFEVMCENRNHLAKIDYDAFYHIVNNVVYKHILPDQCEINVTMGRYTLSDYIMEKNDSAPDEIKTMHIYLRDRGSHGMNIWDLYEIMWRAYVTEFHNDSVHGPIDNMFLSMTFFEDFFN